MPYDRDGEWYDDPNEVYDGPLSPYEQAVQNGGQEAGDALLEAANEYYTNYPNGDADDPNRPETNWLNPASYDWLINTPTVQTAGGDPTPTDPGGGDDGSGGGGSGGGGGMSTVGTGTFGAIPAPFGENYTMLARPAHLAQPYRAPVWTPPTMDDVMAMPGYTTRLVSGVQARDASAAAQGSVLSGGHQKRMEKYGQEFGAGEYANEYARRYGAFQDDATRGYQARLANEDAYQSDVGNNLNQYLARFNAYQTAIGNTRNAEQDYWQRNRDLINGGLSANGML